MTELSDPLRRRTSISYIALCRAVGIASGVASGAATGITLVPDAIASGNPLNIAVPLILAGVVPFAVSAGWHMTYGYGAHAREKHERAIALGFGGGLSLVSLGLSGWLLATVIGGAAALQDYQHRAVEYVRAASDYVSGNLAVEANIVTALNTAANNLAAAADSECTYGLFTPHPGEGPVCRGIRNAASGLVKMRRDLMKQQQEVNEALARSDEALASATRDIAARDMSGFQDDMAKAVAEVRAAEKVHLGVESLNIGLAVPAQAESLINQTTSGLSSVMSNINSNRHRVVTVPDYQPIDQKTAMLKNPQLTAWLAAVVVDLLPMICLGLLLTIWRDEETPPPRQSDSDEPPHYGPAPDLERPRPRVVSSVPAE